MKRLMILLAVLVVFSISAQAQMGEGMKPEQKGQMGHGMMGGEGKMPMMPMCEQMMKQKMGEGQQMPMMQDMMQMMMETMKMQHKIMKGVKPGEKKAMMTEMEGMMQKMEKMMEGMQDMPMKCKCMMAPMEPKKEEMKKDAPAKEEAPKADPHKH